MCRIAGLVFVVSGFWALVAGGSSADAMARPKAGEARLVAGEPPMVESPPQHPAGLKGAGAKVAVRWTKHVRLGSLAELEKYEALIRTPLGDCQELAGVKSPESADTPARPPCTCAEYFEMDEGGKLKDEKT